MKDKKGSLKTARQNSKKKPAGKSGKPATPAQKAVSRAKENVKRAEALRVRNVKDSEREDIAINEWTEKFNAAKSREERAAIDEKYSKKVKELEAKEGKSYRDYYNHVHKHFTKEQHKAALEKSGNFISREYTKELLKAVKNGK